MHPLTNYPMTHKHSVCKMLLLHHMSMCSAVEPSKRSEKSEKRWCWSVKTYCSWQLFGLGQLKVKATSLNNRTGVFNAQTNAANQQFHKVLAVWAAIRLQVFSKSIKKSLVNTNEHTAKLSPAGTFFIIRPKNWKEQMLEKSKWNPNSFLVSVKIDLMDPPRHLSHPEPGKTQIQV